MTCFPTAAAPSLHTLVPAVVSTVPSDMYPEVHERARTVGELIRVEVLYKMQRVFCIAPMAVNRHQ
jgi:hypothetical protein